MIGLVFILLEHHNAAKRSRESNYAPGIVAPLNACAGEPQTPRRSTTAPPPGNGYELPRPAETVLPRSRPAPVLPEPRAVNLDAGLRRHDGLFLRLTPTDLKHSARYSSLVR